MLVVHFKLFRSKRQVEDVDRILEEARRVEEEQHDQKERDGIAQTNHLLNLSKFMLMLSSQNKFIDQSMKAAREVLDNQTTFEVKGESEEFEEPESEDKDDEDMVVEYGDEDDEPS